MSHEPTRDRRNDSHAADDGTGSAADLLRRYPSLKPSGAYGKLPAIPLHRPITLVGSRKSARVHLNSSTVSRAHALLVVTRAGVTIADLHSREGTVVNGRKVEEVELNDGDAIQIGRFTFTLHDPRQREPAGASDAEPAQVRVESPAGKRRVPLTRRVTVVGRRSGSGVHLPFDDVSTANAAIVRLDGFGGESRSMTFDGFAVFDLGGKGTTLNGRAVHKGRLTARDRLQIGPARLSLVFAPQTPISLPASPPPLMLPAAAEAYANDAEVAVADDEETLAVESFAIAPPPSRDLAGDELSLSDDLTDDGLEKDLLGGSFVMDALSEPTPEPAGMADAAEQDESGTGDDEPSWDSRPVAEVDGPDEVPVAESGDAIAWTPRERADTEWEDAAQLETGSNAIGSGLAGVEEFEPLDELEVNEADQPDTAGVRHASVNVEVDEVDAEIDVDALFGDEAGAVGPPAEMDAGAAVDVAGFTDDVIAPVDDASEGKAHMVAAVDVDTPGSTLESASESLAFAGAGDDWPRLDETTAPEFGIDDGVASAPTADDSVDEAADHTADVSVDEAIASPAAAATPPVVPVDVDLSQLDFTASTAPPEQRVATLGGADADELEPVSSEELAPHVSAELPDATVLANDGFDGRNDDADEDAPAIDTIDAAEDGTGARRDVETVEPALEAVAEWAIDSTLESDAPDPLGVTFDDDDAGSGVLAATQPTPDSALDLSALDLAADDEDEWHAHTKSETTLPTDSEFLQQVEQLGEPGEPLIDAADRNENQTEGDAVAASDFVTETAPAGAAVPTREDWRGEWSLEQSAFIGNVAPLDLRTPSAASSETPPGEPSDALPEARPTARVAPESEPALEQLPEGLGDDTQVPPPSSAPGKQEPGKRVPPPTPGRRRVGGAPAPRPGQQRSGEATPAPRPRKVGFGGVLAEVEAVAPDAQGPFSTAPLGGGMPGLDPSATIPETSGLLGVADVFNLPSIGAPAGARAVARATEPLIPFGPPVLDDAGARDDVPDTDLRDYAQQRRGRESGLGNRRDPAADSGWHVPPRPQPPTPGTRDNGRDNGQSFEALDDDAVDAFLRTVRGGVSGLSNVFDVNGLARGNGEVAAAEDLDLPGGPNGAADSFAAASVSGPTLLLRAGQAARPTRGAAPKRTRPPIMGGTTVAEQADAMSAPAARRRRVWAVPLLVALMVVSMIAAVVGIYRFMPPTSEASMKVRYDLPPGMSQSARAEYQDRQIQRLRQPPTREAAAQGLARAAPSVDPDYLAAPDAYAVFAANAEWDAADPTALVLSRTTADRAGEVYRLKAVANALYAAGGVDREAINRLSADVRQKQSDLERLLRDAQDLTRQIEELSAGRPQIPADPSAAVTRERELQEKIQTLDEQWATADRRVAQVKAQVDALAGSDATADDGPLAALRRRLAEVEEKIASLQVIVIDPDAAEVGADAFGDAPLDQPADTKAARAAIEKAVAALRESANIAAKSLDADSAAALRQDVAAMAEATTRLLDETLPRHLRAAGEVEMARQALAMTRRERVSALLSADEVLRSLLSEAALKERELGAADADGLEQRAAGIRLTLRMLQDRIAVRQEDVERQADNDEAVAALAQTFAQSDAAARRELTRDRDAARVQWAELSRAIAAGSRSDAAVRAAVARLTAGAAALVERQTAELPLAADVWSVPAKATNPAQAAAPAPGQVMAFSSVGGDDPPTLIELQTEAAQLRREIEQREAELRGAHEAEVTRLSQELAAAKATAARADRDAKAARTELGDLHAARLTAERETHRLGELRSRQADVESQIKQARDGIEQADAALQTLATPRAPSDADLDVPVPKDDARFRTIIMSLVGITVVFLAFIFLTLRGDARG